MKKDNNIRKISLPQISSGIDCPKNSSITISFGSFVIKYLLKKKKKYENKKKKNIKIRKKEKVNSYRYKRC